MQFDKFGMELGGVPHGLHHHFIVLAGQAQNDVNANGDLI